MIDWAALVLYGLSALAEQETTSAEEGGFFVEPAFQEVDFSAFERSLDAFAIESWLAELAADHPRHASVASIGTSAGGRDLPLLILTDTETGPASEKPALLFVGGAPAKAQAHKGRGGRASDGQGSNGTSGESEPSFGSEAALAFAWAVTRELGSNGELDALLDGTVIYVLPELDPDASAAEGPSGSSPDELARNFPMGWMPGTIRHGSGSFPLSKPEALAFVRFLAEHPNVAVVAGAGLPAAEPGPWPGADLPEEDVGVFGLLEESPLLAWPSFTGEGGSLYDYCYQALGQYPLLLEQSEGLSEGPELAAWVGSGARRILDVLRLLPRLRLEQTGLQTIAPGLWQLDVTFENPGLVPTMSVLGAQRERLAEIELFVRGAELVACARRGAEEETFEVSLFQENGLEARFQEPALGGGERRWLRLLLRGEEGQVVELIGSSSWAGRTSLRLEL